MTLLLDQPARVSWVEMGQMLTQSSGSKLVPDSRHKDFESVRIALRFIMETMNKGSQPSAQIHTDGATLYQADIEKMYAAIK
jgi:hypothetical protein